MEKRKYHLAKWDMVCQKKEYGGLGVKIQKGIKSSTFFFGKWWWQLINPHCTCLWKDVILRKSHTSRVKSPFWKAVELERELVNLGARMSLGNGCHTHFWTDRWLGEMSLAHMYPHLDSLAQKPSLLVSEAWEEGQGARFRVTFKRHLTVAQTQDWEEVQKLIQAFSPGATYTLIWRQSDTGYSVKSQ